MPDTMTQEEVERVLGSDSKGIRQRLSRRTMTLAALALLVVAIGYVTIRALSGGDEVAFVTRPVERGAMTVTVSATGTLQPVNEVDVGIEVSGTIAEVLVDFNDRVEAGDVLARLDTAVLEAQAEQSRSALALARASLALAEASETEAEANLRRLETLRELSDGVVPPERDLDAARAAFARAEASVASERARIREVEARLRVNEVQLGKALVTSPINGVVLSRLVDPGQTVAASLQTPRLFVLAEDLAEMELHVDVDEADVGQVAEGQPAVFTVDAYPNDTFPAGIDEVRFAPSATEGVVTYETVLSVDNSDLRLRPGMTATAEITVDQIEDALLIPNEALRFVPIEPEADDTGGFAGAFVPRIPAAPPSDINLGRGAEKQIWVLRDGAAEAITVFVGATDGRMTQIVSGDLTEGTEIIIDQAGAS